MQQNTIKVLLKVIYILFYQDFSLQIDLPHIFFSLKVIGKLCQQISNILCIFPGILTYQLFRDGPKPILKIFHSVIMITVYSTHSLI